MEPTVSIVILSYNRPMEIERNVKELVSCLRSDIEIIVVDNYSEVPVSSIISDFIPRVKVIRTEENVGVDGRNIGILEASGNYIITLDDDVFGLCGYYIDEITKSFEDDPQLSAINFKIVDDLTEDQINWIHHRELVTWKNQKFETYEISEGAVALRKAIFLSIGGYPSRFFISHEGPDLALRMLDAGFTVIYDPCIVVRHSHSPISRDSWRRYYFDTRNVIWLGIRNYPLNLFVKKISIALLSQLIYSIRDGYLKYWIKGVSDGLTGISWALESRKRISKTTLKRYYQIQSFEISLISKAKLRLFSKDGIKI